MLGMTSLERAKQIWPKKSEEQLLKHAALSAGWDSPDAEPDANTLDTGLRRMIDAWESGGGPNWRDDG